MNGELPSIRVAVTEDCNLQCDYCPADGDSVEMQGEALDAEGFGRMLDAACKAGFTDFSFTGGEPLLSPKTAAMTFDLAKLVNEARQGEGYTKLNTNGANLLRYQDEVVGSGFTELKVSLDTLDPGAFQSLAKRNERVLTQTIDGIVAVKDEVPVRLQTVVGKYNAAELPDMISFCREQGLDIKLFDLSRYDNALAGSGKFSEDNYVSLAEVGDSLRGMFGEPEIVYAVGGYGHAKQVYTTPEGTRIQLRDTANSAHYAKELCEDCPQYICQDGLCNLVIAADGHIRFCREGGEEQTISTRTAEGELMEVEEVQAALVRAAGVFATAESIERPIGMASRLYLPLTVINNGRLEGEGS